MFLKKIIKGIQEVKGENISILNFKKKENLIYDYFVICDGKSRNQVYAIFQSIEKIIKNEFKQMPRHIEGLKNKNWILVDYINIVIHIFQKEFRSYYNIEGIWNDILYNV
ncbi:ribosome silencing factor [Blattabacterium cuenoti]|uniref:ribosome silencing factor n=1 Tax=Blattabacterium cuenoti TaxID=1653831 RepID=UPI00163B6E38|nr:ribosome silencing factor [Blattabacterium cuenoti]